MTKDEEIAILKKQRDELLQATKGLDRYKQYEDLVETIEVYKLTQEED